MSWTDERVELLKRLWNQGLSASQIAGELGAGVTRNAVIGKVHRLGLSGRAKSPAPAAARPRKATRAPSHPMSHGAHQGGGGGGGVRGNLALSSKPAVAPSPMVYVAPTPRPEVEVVVPMSERVTIMELRESMCRWPHGDPTSPEFRFCGAKSPPGTPYCGYHAQIAYQPSVDRRKKAAPRA
ncbi:GcrA cell cycle regulator [Alsobacter sp. SYSU M60028]|uniref:GcrA cell cycle regulator n=1 Tax=Alsobacter ponti TaxID=2962936 RepID=A0ABT1LIX8_9HYPH|nr:GcrA family cell cycle regulator [Alsobacter ponti]MCP8941081.1 GcrA cell cycle regulator [Alsobacter ponti]